MLAWARDASRPSVANPRSSLASAHRLSKAATGSLTPCSKAELLKRMFWNLVVVNYEKYRLHHILLFGLLIVYSIAGALVFCGLESDHEDLRNREEVRHLVKQSVAAKKELVERIQAMQYAYPGSPLNITELRKAIDKYDVSMEMKPAIQREKRWDMWGGLYYAGTIYTTIACLYDSEWKTNAWRVHGELIDETTSSYSYPYQIEILPLPNQNSTFSYSYPYQIEILPLPNQN